MENTKTAKVRPIFKKDEKTKVKNYQRVSLLYIFSKIYKRFTHENLTPFDFFLSESGSAYWKTWRLIENWKKSLVQNKFVGSALMDLSNAFDCILDDFLITKMNSFGFSSESVTFFYSNLKGVNKL